MRRIHLFEWNDQRWLPEVLRRGETEYLATVIDLARPFAPLAPKIAQLCERHGDRVVDLASGFVRPLSGWRLVLTYVVPVLPLLILWDGVVSCLRTYRPDELLALTRDLDGFRWDAGELRARGNLVTYLIGEPVP